MITAPDQRLAEEDLSAGRLRCPRCPGALRPHGWARRRTVRGPGQQRLAVTPRRARCPDCRTTHVLLPGELVPRRADSASVIGQALVDKALGHGWRSIAERAGRPQSTVRRWRRAAPDSHACRLQQRAEQVAVRLEPELIDPWSAPRDRLAAAGGHPAAQRRGLAPPDQLGTAAVGGRQLPGRGLPARPETGADGHPPGFRAPSTSRHAADDAVTTPNRESRCPPTAGKPTATPVTPPSAQ